MTATEPRGQGARDRIAVVASDEQRPRIVRVLAPEDFELEFLDGDGAPAEEGGAPCSLVLLHFQESAQIVKRLERLKPRFGEAAFVVVCPAIERREVRAALAAGVVGVVLDRFLESTLRPCLWAVQSGQICVPREHGDQVEPPALSSREKQILGLVVMSLSNAQIAEQLFLAESTVKSHLSSAFAKLGVRSRNEAVSLILDPNRGFGMGILALGGEPLELEPSGLP
jgi:DNA-binding NarL/FixJ family response regulator